MTKSTKRSHEKASETDRALDGADATGGHAESAAKDARKPYSRPSVEKRRSVNYATLVSGTGTSGAFTTG